MTQAGPRPASQRRVCRIETGGGNPDPSRAGARDRPAGGRDDRDVLQDSVGDVGALPAQRPAAPRLGTRASSRRVRDRKRGKCQRAGHTPGTYAPEGSTPRGRSAERAPSTIHGNIMQNEQRLIRPAAASSRSRGPGGLLLQVLTLRRAHLISSFFRAGASQGIVLASITVAVSDDPLWVSIRPEGGVVQLWCATLGQFSRALKLEP